MYLQMRAQIEVVGQQFVAGDFKNSISSQVSFISHFVSLPGIVILL